MRKWIWASTVLTVALACGLYSFASWAGNHPLSVLNYGARLASVVGAGHARAAARQCPAPPDADDGPRAIVQELPDAEPSQEISEPIVVENAQPIELYETPAYDPPDQLPPPVEETVPPVLVMPPCPEDVEKPGLRTDNALRQLAEDHASDWRVGLPSSAPVSPGYEPLIQTSATVNGPVSDCAVDPNYHHQYPGCPWMGGCQNIPAYVPLAPVARTRTRPAKDKWLTMHALMEQMGLSDMDESEEPTPVREDEDSSNLSDIIF